MDAAILSREMGRPVRVQACATRHGWDPKGPASVHRARAGIDAQGKVIAYHSRARAFRASTSRQRRPSQRQPRRAVEGLPLASRDAFGVPQEAYVLRPPAHGLGDGSRHCSTALRRFALRTCATRRTANAFASESFIDELAVAVGLDAVEFRCAISGIRATSPR